jgi:hypothetical protein
MVNETRVISIGAAFASLAGMPEPAAYGDVAGLIARTAAVLSDLGVRCGDRGDKVHFHR